jgi:hypothetical protein
MINERANTDNGVGMTRFTVYAVAIFGTFLIMAALVWWTYRYTRPPPLGADRIQERYKYLSEQREADAKALNEYAWQDKDKEIVRLPIQRALEIAAQESRDPAAARSNLVARVEKAAAPAPEKPNIYE